MSWEVVVWFVAAAVGLGVTSWSVIDAYRNLEAVHALNGPLTERAARDSLWDERLRWLAQLDMVLVVLLVIFLPVDVRTIAVRLCLTALPVLLMVKSVRGALARRRIVAYHQAGYGRRAGDQ
jgi:hypothetical protein